MAGNMTRWRVHMDGDEIVKITRSTIGLSPEGMRGETFDARRHGEPYVYTTAVDELQAYKEVLKWLTSKR